MSKKIGTIVIDPQLSPEELKKIKKDFQEAFTGSANAHMVILKDEKTEVIDFEAKEFGGAYADDDREEEENG